jgi:hypothetical protein
MVLSSSAADSKNGRREGELRVEIKVATRPNLVIARFRFIDVTSVIVVPYGVSFYTVV